MVKKTCGFTLLEILITLFILSILGAMITSGLHMIMKSQSRIETKIKSLGELQLALLTIESDLQQFKNQPMLNATGSLQSAFYISDTGFEFTKGGSVNPRSGSNARSLQRIYYQLKGNALYRMVKTVDATNPNLKPTNHVLLNHVTQFKVQMLPKINPYLDPSSQNSTPQDNLLRVGVMIEITSELGYMKRIIALPINGFAQDQNGF